MEPARVLPDSWLSVAADRLSLRSTELDRLVRHNSQLAEACMDYVECLLVLEEASHSEPAPLKRIREYRALESEIRLELLDILEQSAAKAPRQ